MGTQNHDVFGDSRFPKVGNTKLVNVLNGLTANPDLLGQHALAKKFISLIKIAFKRLIDLYFGDESNVAYLTTQAGQPVLILKEGTTRRRGRDVQRNNIMAARIIAEVLTLYTTKVGRFSGG